MSDFILVLFALASCGFTGYMCGRIHAKRELGQAAREALARDKLIMLNARRYAQRSLQNWALYRDIFGVGSTTAASRCLEMGIDPDATTVKR